jgi:hypothetical protein
MTAFNFLSKVFISLAVNWDFVFKLSNHLKVQLIQLVASFIDDNDIKVPYVAFMAAWIIAIEKVTK